MAPRFRSLAQIISSGLDSKAPYHGETQGVFRSHYDWHSSVHAHWALLSIARISKNSNLSESVLSRLTEASLEDVRADLNRDETFECPYGQAWLLLLLFEMEKHGRKSTELRSETIVRTFKWLEYVPFPDGNEDGTCRGDYQSWIFAYLLLKESLHRGEFSNRLRSLSGKLANLSSVQDERNPGAFLSPRALSHVLNSTSEKRPSFKERIKTFPDVKLENCHQIGVLISESWPYAAAGKMNLESRKIFESFLADIFNEPRLWRDQFVTVSHWIPQYLWFGMWLAIEDRA